MPSNKKLTYAVAAIVVAIVIAGAYIYIPPMTSTGSSQSQTSTPGQTSTSTQGSQTSTAVSGQTPTYAVLLTDPPQLPSGTQQLNMSYSRVSVLVTAANGTSKWVSVSVSGTVDLASMANVTQTIASAKVAAGSVVRSIQITVSGIQAKVNGTVQTAVSASKNITISVSNQSTVGQNGQTTAGAVVDLSPTLAQVRAVNASSGAESDAFVFVPSGVALGNPQVQQNQTIVGARSHIHSSLAASLSDLRLRAAQSLNVTSATLTTSGNVTSLSLTITNNGNSSASLFGLVLSGPLNMSLGVKACISAVGTCVGVHARASASISHPGAIPFVANGTSLDALLGFGLQASGNMTGATIAAGQSVTLTFSGSIAVTPPSQGPVSASISLTPVSGQSYTIRLMGEGSTTFQVTAS